MSGKRMSDEEFALHKQGRALQKGKLLREAERARASEKRLAEALSNLVALAELDSDFNDPGVPDCYAAMHAARAALSEVEG